MRSLHLVVGRIVAESQQNPLVRYNLFPLIFGWHILTNSLDDRREKRGGEGRGGVENGAKREKGEEEEVVPLRLSPIPSPFFSRFPNLLPRVFLPYCACWLDEKSSFADRWSKGTKTQGTRVLLSPPISTLSTQANQG